jgi:hypothetical protein
MCHGEIGQNDIFSAWTIAALFPLNEHDADLGIVSPDGLACSDGLACG